MTNTETTPDAWVEVCAYEHLPPERGVAALVGDHQVALFRTHEGEVFAVGNRDPFSDAYVMARGIVGSSGDTPTVASPMYKHVFDLRTGHCLGDRDARLPTFRVRREGDRILVRATPERGGAADEDPDAHDAHDAHDDQGDPRTHGELAAQGAER